MPFIFFDHNCHMCYSQRYAESCWSSVQTRQWVIPKLTQTQVESMSEEECERVANKRCKFNLRYRDIVVSLICFISCSYLCYVVGKYKVIDIYIFVPRVSWPLSRYFIKKKNALKTRFRHLSTAMFGICPKCIKCTRWGV